MTDPADSPASAAASTVAADPVRGLVVAASGAGEWSLRSERRLVTALFADISGFSELTDRLDAEELLEVIDPVVSALSNVVGRFGGVVEKFAGDALLALFGAPLAHDDDAARALKTALEMHRELAALVPELGPAASNLQLHIGVNSGHGIGRVLGSDVRLDYGVLGDVVVLAQRLEAAAPPGETYVGDTTYELTFKRFVLEPLGELTVKGKAEPVRAWRLVSSLDDGAVASPSHRPPVLAGREPELAALCELVSDGGSKARPAAGFVVGEAGAGKTVLCEAIRARAEAAGLRWLSARCVSYGVELAYWPFADLFRRMFGLEDATRGDALALVAEQLAELSLADTLPFVAGLCGVEGAPPSDLGAKSFQVRVHESVVAVLRAQASQRATVLHLDDLHWADGPTVALLRDVLGACLEMPLAVLVSARPEALALVAELENAVPDAAVRVELGPLPKEAVRELAAKILGAPPSNNLLAALSERTLGNPFFVEEVTRSLVERGELVELGGEWHTRADWDSDQVPLTIEGILASRIDTLREPERDALEVLSIIGRRADRELARAVSGSIEGAVPGLVESGLLDPPDEKGVVLSIHHPLIQQVVYSRLLRRRRARLHTLVGEAAETLYGVDDASIDIFARHYYLGETPKMAYPYLVRAADRAEALYANEQALAHLHRALELVGTGPDRQELVLRCARLEEIVGRYDDALVLYREVREATGEFRAAIGEVATLRKLGRYDDGRDAIKGTRAEHANPTPAQTAALALEEGWLLGLLGDNQRSADVLEEGLAAIADRDDDLEGQLCVVLARQLELLDREAEALQKAERARLLFERTDDLPRLAMTLRVLGGIQHNQDDAALPQARETLEQANALANRVGNAEEQAASLINLAVVLADLGEHEAALEADRQALAGFGSAGLKAGVACTYCNMAEHLCELGRWKDALEAAHQGLAVAEEIDSPFWITGALNGIARSANQLGDYEGAATAAERGAERALAHGLRDRARHAFEHAAIAHDQLGNLGRAEELRHQASDLTAL